MLSLQSLFSLQSRFGVGDLVVSAGQIPFETYLLECRRMLSDKTPVDYYQWDMERQMSFTDGLIISFVNSNKKDVEGYFENGVMDIVGLKQELSVRIMDYGVLRDALDDDAVQEIQINDYRSIWLVKGGKSELYLDASGNSVQFCSDEELGATLNRLTYNTKGTTPRMTITDPLLNCRATRTGFRVSTVHSSAVTSDMPPFDFPVTTITIRKFSRCPYTLSDLVKFDSLTEEMARFLGLCGKANIRLFFVGPTSSGKTTLMYSVILSIPSNQRMILIQNPTEILVYNRDDHGTNERNVLHWEAQDVPSDLVTSNSPTMSNLISHALRNTPDVIIPGEMRTPQEFAEANRGLKTGHRLLSTFHADNAQDGIVRFATEVSSLGGVSGSELKQELALSIDLIVSQVKLEDGKRRVMEIAELTGNILPNGLPEINMIFKFEVTGESEEDPVSHAVTKIHGEFKYCNPISDKLRDKFYIAGVNKSVLWEFLKNP